MTRIQAFAVHFGISLLIFSVLGALVLLAWYPDFFFATDGGWQGLRIIALVDLVLGPLLTLIVYRAGKPGLKLDLAMIGLLQCGALLAGTYVVYDERPLALVYVDGQFNAMTADSYRSAGLATPDFSGYPGRSPKWLMVAVPQDPARQSELRRDMLRRQLPMAFLTELYKPFDATDPLVMFDAAAIADIRSRDFEGAGFEKFLADHGGDLADYRFYPYAARYEYYYLGFEAEQQRLAGMLKTSAPKDPAAS